MRTIRLMSARLALVASALLVVALVLVVADRADAAVATVRQATPDAAGTADDPCAEIVAAGTPAVEHGEGPGAFDPVPPEQTGELGNPADYAFDLTFLDALIAHHEGAIRLAEIALVRAEHEELRELARLIVETRAAEIGQLREWRTAWYGDADPVPANVTVGLMDEGLMLVGGPADAGQGMGGPATGTVDDAYRLCTATGSFDLAFLDRQIPHHQSAVGMALLARERAEHEELRTFAEAFVAARQDEIARMTEWQAAWMSEATPAAAFGSTGGTIA